MLLTKDEEKALSGELGKSMSMVYKILLSIGEATDATNL